MFALNFQSQHHERLLITRQKNCTVRLGDVSDRYPDGSIVWITVGKKFQPKRKLYTAFVDRSLVKKISELTSQDLDHQNPEIKSIDDLIKFFEQIYQRTITPEDTVTVIYFSEIIGDTL